MRIFRSKRAETDLIDIWVNIGKDNERAADRMIEQLERRTSSLAEHPFLGRSRPDIARDVRSLTVGAYLILYRVKDENIEIVRYTHGRRDLRNMI